MKRGILGSTGMIAAMVLIFGAAFTSGQGAGVRVPEPPLLSPDPADRALVRLVIERFDVNLGDAYYAFRRGDDDGAERLAHCLSMFERGIGRWPDRYSLAEIAYVPWLIRLRELLGVDLSGYPALVDRLEQLCERPAVAAELDLVAALAR